MDDMDLYSVLKHQERQRLFQLVSQRFPPIHDSSFRRATCSYCGQYIRVSEQTAVNLCMWDLRPSCNDCETGKLQDRAEYLTPRQKAKLGVTRS